ncbi:MAG: fluoride efflux transporter CrcB [Candidatus Promineifilaceae bacterium]
MRYLLIAVGAALGANARYLVGMWAGARFGADFPYGTLLVNITGSLALGFLSALVTGRLRLSPDMRLLLAVGFLGSYTTFSSYTVESMTLLRQGAAWLGLLNILGNNVLGLVCALLGVYLGQMAAR